MIWSVLTDKLVSNAILTADKDINRWFDIYSGKPDWLQIEYTTLEGKKRKRTKRQLGIAKFSCSDISRLIMCEPPKLLADESISNWLDSLKFWDTVLLAGDLLLNYMLKTINYI